MSAMSDSLTMFNSAWETSPAVVESSARRLVGHRTAGPAASARDRGALGLATGNLGQFAINSSSSR